MSFEQCLLSATDELLCVSFFCNCSIFRFDYSRSVIDYSCGADAVGGRGEGDWLGDGEGRSDQLGGDGDKDAGGEGARHQSLHHHRLAYGRHDLLVPDPYRHQRCHATGGHSAAGNHQTCKGPKLLGWLL